MGRSLEPDDLLKIARFVTERAEAGSFTSPDFHSEEPGSAFPALAKKYVFDEADSEVRENNRRLLHAGFEMSRLYSDLPEKARGTEDTYVRFLDNRIKEMGEDRSMRRFGNVLGRLYQRRALAKPTPEEAEQLLGAKARRLAEQPRSLFGQIGHMAGTGFAEVLDPFTGIGGLMSDVPVAEGVSIPGLEAAQIGAQGVIQQAMEPGEGGELGHTFASRALQGTRALGAATPIIAGASILQPLGAAGAAKLGAGPGVAQVLGATVTGGTIGGLTTPGGFKERGLGTVFGAAGFGGAAVLGRVMQPHLARFQETILGKSLRQPAVEELARKGVAKVAPLAVQVPIDAAAFTSLGMVEGMMHGRAESVGDLFIQNMLAVAAFRAVHSGARAAERGLIGVLPPKAGDFLSRDILKLPSDFAKDVRTGEKELIRTEFERAARLKQPLELRTIRDQLIDSGRYDSLNVILAQRAALKGLDLTGLTVKQMGLLWSNPQALQKMLSPTRTEDLFRPDAREAQMRDFRETKRLNKKAGRALAQLMAARREKAAATVDEIQFRKADVTAKASERRSTRDAKTEELRVDARQGLENARARAREMSLQAEALERGTTREQGRLEGERIEGRAVPAPERQVRAGEKLTEAEAKYLEPAIREAAEAKAVERVGPPEQRKVGELDAELSYAREIRDSPVVEEILKPTEEAGVKFSLRPLMEHTGITPPRRETVLKPWTIREMVQALREAKIAPKFLDTKRPRGNEPGARQPDGFSSEPEPARVVEWLVELSKPRNKNVGQIKGRIKSLEREILKEQKSADQEWESEVQKAAKEFRPDAERDAREQLADDYRRAEAVETGRERNQGNEFDPFFFEPVSDAAIGLYRGREAIPLRPSDPAGAAKLRSEARSSLVRAETRAKSLEARAAKADRNSATLEHSELGRARQLQRRVDRVEESVREIRPKELEDLMDVSARLTPQTARMATLLKEGSVPEQLGALDRLEADMGIPSPASKWNLRNLQDPQTIRLVGDTLRRIPPDDPGSARARLYAELSDYLGKFGRPRAYDFLRGAWRTNEKFLPQPHGRTLYLLMAEAATKQARLQRINLKLLETVYNDYTQWLRKLPGKELQEQSLNRVARLDEGGSTEGTSVAETQFLTTLSRYFGRKARMMKALGIQTREGGYFLKAFDTIESFGNPAQRALAEEFGTFAGVGDRTLPTMGSRHFRHRVSDRRMQLEDVTQLGQLLTAYENSTSRATSWRNVHDYMENVIKPRVFGRHGVASARAIRRGEKTARTRGKKGVDIPEMQRFRENADAALKFMEEQIATASGKHSNVLQPWNRSIEIAIRRSGLRADSQLAKAPLNALLGSYVALQYLGGLGMNIGAAVKNATQFVVNTLPNVSPLDALTGLRKMWMIQARFNRDGSLLNKIMPVHVLHPAVRASGVIEGRFSNSLIPPTMSGRAVRVLKAAGDLTMSVFTGVETFNRGSTYMIGYEAAKRLGMTDAQARRDARLLVANTQYDYLPGISGRLYRNPIGHALAQFSRFPIYQTDWLTSLGMRAVQNSHGMRARGGGLLDRNPLTAIMGTGLALLGLNYALQGLGVDLTESFGIGGLIEPGKFGLTRMAEALGDVKARSARTPEQRATGAPGGTVDEAREEMRAALRAMGLESRASNLSDMMMQSMGPLARQASVAARAAFGTPEERRRAEQELGKAFVVAIPGGVALHRYLRFRREYAEKQVRNSRTGDLLFPITEGDAIFRVFGVMTGNVGDSYDEISIARRRIQAAKDLTSRLYDDSRHFLRDKMAAGTSKDEAMAETAARFLAGWQEINALTSVDLSLTSRELAHVFRQNVAERVLLGERMTELERVRKDTRGLRSNEEMRGRIEEMREQLEEAEEGAK